MNLIIDFADHSVTVELLNNPVVEKWVAIAKGVGSWTAWDTNQTGVLAEYTGVRENKELRRKGLISAIRNFEEATGIKFPFSVNDSTDFTRQDLNKIHRYFTTASGFTSWELSGKILIDRDSPDYGIFNECLCVINDAVHSLEGYCSTPNKTLCQDIKIIEFISEDVPANYYSLQPGDWRYLDYDLEYDVFIRHAILGKDYFQGFIDEDDPANWDVTAQTALHTNNFYVDVDGKRNEFMRSEVFKMYVERSSLYNGAWQCMPLGRIVSGKLGDLTTFKGIRFE